jgi:hypothetical protein
MGDAFQLPMESTGKTTPKRQLSQIICSLQRLQFLVEAMPGQWGPEVIYNFHCHHQPDAV